jgi:release factor glutamine methyltransferase
MLASCSDTPDLDARLLMMKATGWDMVQLLVNDREVLAAPAKETFRDLLKKRLASVPVAYLLGEKEFYGRMFKVSPATLIPRPDTETLVETSIGFIKNEHLERGLDVCTGTGCVGISLEMETGIPFTLSDISTEALQIAKENHQRLIGNDIDHILKTDLLEGLPTYDIIVSNPPYLTKLWCKEANQEVQHEPISALFGMGNDGLDIIRRLIAQAPSHLSSGGRLMLECDYRQVSLVAAMLEKAGFTAVGIWKDLSGKDRVVGGRLCTNN